MLKNDLQQIIKGEVVDDAEALQTYSKDASVFEIKPQVIVYPKDVEDIKALVKYASDHSDTVSLTPRAAGTCMSGGAINDSVIVDMTKYFNKIISVSEDSAITEPGVFYRDFEKETLQKNLILPSYTASKEINTVGGMVGNNSAGELTLKFGQTERYVKRLKIVLSDGNEYEVTPLQKDILNNKIVQPNLEGQVYKQIFDLISQNQVLITSSKPQVSKNSTGYYLWNVWNGLTFDLNKLLVGSQGTLGIVTEIEFSLLPPKQNPCLLVITLNSLDELDKIVNLILESAPDSFECYDDQTIEYAVKYSDEIIKDFKHNTIEQAKSSFIPEQEMVSKKTLPKLTLLANFTGSDPAESNQKATKAAASIKSFPAAVTIVPDVKAAEKFWIIRHNSFNLLRHHAEHMRTAPIFDDIIVKPSTLPEFMPKLKAILDRYKDSTAGHNMLYTIAGHIGDGNFHIIPLVDLTDENIRKLIPEITKEVYNLVFEFKGSMAAEHNDGLIRGPFLEQMYGQQMYQLFKQVKQIFDPKGIFNPHKKVSATFEYSLSHLAKTNS